MTIEGGGQSGRWRIVGWMLATLALALAIVVIVVRSVLLGQVAELANRDVSQELQEFTSFVEEGVDPETGKPFASTQRLFQVYLSRQQAGSHELMVGWLGTGATSLEVRGPQAPSPDEYDLARDPELIAELARTSSGVHQTPMGELRWGRSVVTTGSGAPDALVVGVFTRVPEEQAHDAIRTLTLVSLGSLALAGLLSWVVAGQILRPVRLVRQAAAEITERDLTRRIPVGGRDDISGLAATFNQMLDRLEDAFAAEQRFVDDAGHELRTPITVIRGHLELMGDDPVERQQTIALVTQELDRMARIVTDLLALAKADRPDFVELDELVDLTQLTLDLDAKVQTLANRRWQLRHIAEGSAVVDVQRITQAVLQLAHNAVQHTRDGDVISLMSRFVDDEDGQRVLQISVTDSGPGVAPQDRERIFERFAHGTPADGSRHGGAGLGLPIVKAIAEAHHGLVQLDSPPGQGATFTLVIPVAATSTAKETG
ncbi:HAMP domain-containing sensor histidine kinase [Luteococcus sp. H138]|uniref:sensor histidine kinase n=1 Tax=unclassified Luteococcus TaxID=2639923 RepID=UPI00313C416D